MASLSKFSFSSQAKFFVHFKSHLFFFPFPSLQSHLYEHPSYPPGYHLLLFNSRFGKKFNCIYHPRHVAVSSSTPKISYVCIPHLTHLPPCLPTTCSAQNTISFLRAGLANLTRLYELIKKHLPCENLRRYSIIELQAFLLLR